MSEGAPADAPPPVAPPARATVIGAGTMGHGIAQVLAMAGAETTLVDRTTGLVEDGLGRIRDNLDGGVDRGKVDPALREAALAKLHGDTDPARASAGVDLVVEAVPERLELKRAIMARVEDGADPAAVLASNTSSLSITALQEGLRHPERVIGLHYFNPVHIMKLVEVVRGERTAPDTVDRAVAWSHWMGKEPIVVRDAPGFASSRLGVALGLEAIRMVEDEVASPADIDRAMTLGYRHPMGPLRLTDLVGLDVRLHIAEHLHEHLGERFRPPQLLRDKVAAGELGQKTGRGFFDWT